MRWRPALLVVAVSSLVQLPAAAHTKSFESQIFVTGFTKPPPTVKGFVSSVKSPCVVNRKMRIQKIDDTSIFVSTTTGSDGKWEANMNDVPDGDYEAVALRKVFTRSATHRHSCKRAVSTSFSRP